MPAYNNIHRQQLFHWIGSHIDARRTDGLTDPLRVDYIECLREALQEGLWVKIPRDPDYLGDGSLIKVHRPITCFTEWTLGQSLPHTRRYGRLGLGFPKKFVLAHGGQPVTYVRDSSRNDPYSAALKALARFIKHCEDQDTRKLSGHKLDEIRDQFDYLAHFNKRIKRMRLVRRVSMKLRRLVPAKRIKRVSRVPDPFVRVFGSPLHYLEEREWRIVYSSALDDFFQPGRDNGNPNFFLPFCAGRELFTVVLPDNRTVNMALNDRSIFRRLFPKDQPHVTVLSLQDIGTF
jgi:hypothetical protein